MRSVTNCNVCVVGGAGFLGSHMVNHLIDDRGCDVLVVDNLVSGQEAFVHPKAKFEHHDITGSETFLRSLFFQYKVKYVMNYAAYPYVPDSFAHPIRVSDVNFMGAMKVINAAQEVGVEGILQISSAEIYGEGTRHSSNIHRPDFEHNKIDEDDVVCPHSSYGVAKAAVDSAVQVRWREAKTPCIAIRQFNAIGENETHEYIVPEIIRQLSRTDNWTEFSPGVRVPRVHLGNDSFRDFQYAGDAVRMATELLEKGEWGQVYNMGSQDGIKIYNLAKLIGKLMGFEEVTVIQDPARIRPWEIWCLCSDNSKLYSVIDTRPTVSLEEALRRTIKSFQETGNKWCWE